MMSCLALGGELTVLVQRVLTGASKDDVACLAEGEELTLLAPRVLRGASKDDVACLAEGEELTLLAPRVLTGASKDDVACLADVANETSARGRLKDIGRKKICSVTGEWRNNIWMWVCQ